MSQHYPNGRPAILPLMRVRLDDGTIAVILSKLGYVNSVNYFDAISEPSGMHLTVYESSVAEVLDKDVRVHKVQPIIKDSIVPKNALLISRSDVGLDPDNVCTEELKSSVPVDPKLISSLLNTKPEVVFTRSTRFKKYTKG